MASPPSRAMGARPTLSAGVGAAPGPSYRNARCVSTCAIALTCDSQFRPGPFLGLDNALHDIGNLVIETGRRASVIPVMVSRRRQDTPASGNKKSPDLSEPAHTRHGTVSYTSHPLNAGSVLKVDGAPEPPGEIFRRQLFAKAAIAPRETDPQSGSHRKVYSSVQDCSKVVEWSRARAEPCGNQLG